MKNNNFVLINGINAAHTEYGTGHIFHRYFVSVYYPRYKLPKLILKLGERTWQPLMVEAAPAFEIHEIAFRIKKREMAFCAADIHANNVFRHAKLLPFKFYS